MSEFSRKEARALGNAYLPRPKCIYNVPMENVDTVLRRYYFEVYDVQFLYGSEILRLYNSVLSGCRIVLRLFYVDSFYMKNNDEIIIHYPRQDAMKGCGVGVI